jgi:tetratricopeptide (TPR) repeat protein
MGAYEKAEPLYLKDLKISKKVLGEEHPDTATSYNNLALLYESMGAYEKA